MPIPPELVTALKDRYVVPFVGAGVSRAVVRRGTTQPLFPSWSELLRRAAHRLSDEHKRAYANIVEGLLDKPDPDYLQAAMQAREGFGPPWYAFLRKELDPLRSEALAESLSLAKAIWRLPSSLVVTTNYDRVLEWALKEARPAEANDLVRLAINPAAELAAILRRGVERPTVWHMHGHVDDTQSMILTPDGYRMLYPTGVGADIVYESALQTLRHLLAAKTFLFIGFSLEDEQFANQLRWMSEAFGGAVGQHFLLVEEPHLRQTQQRLLGLRGVECLAYPSQGEPLARFLDEIVEVSSLTPSATPTNPIVVAATVLAVNSLPTETLPHASPPVMVEVRRSFRTIDTYQRALFDRLAELSDALKDIGLEFERWDPTYYSRPARSSSEFFRRNYWAWDFLPGFALYLAWQGKNRDKDQCIRRAVVEIDPELEFPDKLGREPSVGDFPVSVEKAKSQFRIYLFKSTDPSGAFNSAWQQLSSKVRSTPHAEAFGKFDHKVAVEGGQVTFRYREIDLERTVVAEDLAENVIKPIRNWFEKT